MALSRNHFALKSNLAPCGDQPKAINELRQAFGRNENRQTLLGVTGSGKTFTVANIIAQFNLPTLVIAHNKTLAAQLFSEFKDLFPDNAVEYFVSYYDYYQPEAYVPATDTFIDKDATINDAIDRMRHSATRALFERNDVIIVASVSCIYGLGSADSYTNMLVGLNVGQNIDRDQVLRRLSEIRYERNDIDFYRGTFRVRGDVLEIFPAHEHEHAIRVEWYGDQIESLTLVDPLRGQKISSLTEAAIYPATHYAVTSSTQKRALESISLELTVRLNDLRNQNKLLEAQRLEQRTRFDLEMIEQTGFCTGIENYSRHLTGRAEGEPPPTLLDYFPNDFLLVVDESHQTIPQIGAMYRGDRSRKETLVNYGFRLPSALDNRPLRFEEFESHLRRVIYVSATPADYEIEQSKGVVVEQLIRPTGLIDPEIEVRPASTQVDDLLEEIRLRVKANQRILVTTLTKRMAEDLTEYFLSLGLKVRYLHSDIDTLERIAILHDLRLGTFDVLIGINLLREGLDLPEVSLVAILDADKEGFLRSQRSLIQTVGRAARNIAGKAILYADRFTDSIKRTVYETNRRREIQLKYNHDNNITPKSIAKAIRQIDAALIDANHQKLPPSLPTPLSELPNKIEELRQAMLLAAKKLDFEQAAVLRDQVRDLEALHVQLG